MCGWSCRQQQSRTSCIAGERLRQAFERTSSRLIEMRSAEYLARERQPATTSRADQ